MAAWRLWWCRVGLLVLAFVFLGSAPILYVLPEGASILGFAFFLRSREST
jgi:hypothetical protein